MKALRRALRWLWCLGAPEVQGQRVVNLDYLYPSRVEIEAAWERGEAPAFGGCQTCRTVRPLELDGECGVCGTLSGVAPVFHRKVAGRWQRVEVG